MCNKTAQFLIKESLNNGYVGEFGALPKSYSIYVTDNSVVFSKFVEDDEELVHLCLNCILLDCDFIRCLFNEPPEPYLKELVCLTLEQKVKYLQEKMNSRNASVFTA